MDHHTTIIQHTIRYHTIPYHHQRGVIPPRQSGSQGMRGSQHGSRLFQQQVGYNSSVWGGFLAPHFCFLLLVWYQLNPYDIFGNLLVLDGNIATVVPKWSQSGPQVVYLWHLSIIFDILEAPDFRKYGTWWVFSVLYPAVPGCIWLYLALPRSAMILPYLTLPYHRLSHTATDRLKCFCIYRLKWLGWMEISVSIT